MIRRFDYFYSMFRWRKISFVILLALLVSGCITGGESKLSKALTGAVKENKISAEKKENILREYDMLQDENNEKARQYVLQIVNAIEMGGDSTHIDVIRHQVIGERIGV